MSRKHNKLDETSPPAINKAAALLAEAMRQENVTRKEMAERLKTSRAQVNRLLNPNHNPSLIQELLGDFDPDWRLELENILVDERKSAIDSIVDLRNTIAHGNPAGLTYSRICYYYQQAQHVIDQVEKLCVPGR